MYGKTKAEKLEDYCIKNNVDFFMLSEDEKRSMKRNMETFKEEKNGI